MRTSPAVRLVSFDRQGNSVRHRSELAGKNQKKSDKGSIMRWTENCPSKACPVGVVDSNKAIAAVLPYRQEEQPYVHSKRLPGMFRSLTMLEQYLWRLSVVGSPWQIENNQQTPSGVRR